MNGRLIFVPLADCTVLETSAEEAFKWLLSGGNYVPAEIGPALAPALHGDRGPWR
jgi:hypothetical protein